jgi:hypothetical protein
MFARIELADVGPYESLADLLEWVRGLDGRPQNPPPPPMPAVIRLPRVEGPRLMREAARVWVTEVRPQVMLDGCCARIPRGPEACVSLGRVELAVPAGLQVTMADVVGTDESERPVLLSSLALQGLMLAGAIGGLVP